MSWQDDDRRRAPHAALIEGIAALSWPDVLRAYHAAWDLTRADLRYLCRLDRYFLLLSVCGRRDLVDRHPESAAWLYRRCREVEAAPDGRIDLWAREHYKSTIITFAGIIQEILRDPEITIGVFAFNRPTAKAFLKQVKRELEGNAVLHDLFPDVLWPRPSMAPSWSLDGGLVVRRESNPKEATVEAWGLVDGQPTGRHFDLRVYDDVVTRESVTTEAQVRKVTEARELSDNLAGGLRREWNIGTRYSFADTYGTLLSRGVVVPRIYPATADGTLDGAPVFLDRGTWEQKKRNQPTQIAAQMLQNPLAGSDKMFRAAWLRSYRVRPRLVNVYIMGDPSKGTPSRRSDRTAIAVVALDDRGNKYLIDGVRHRMSLSERWSALRNLYRRWSGAPGVQEVTVGWEQFGLASDLEYFQERMERERLSFAIRELQWPRDHAQSKADRVERLVPDIQHGRFRLPYAVHVRNRRCLWHPHAERDEVDYQPLVAEPREWAELRRMREADRLGGPIKRLDEGRAVYDLAVDFITEAMFFPFGAHDDLIDAVSRIYDLDPLAPVAPSRAVEAEPPVYVDS